MDQADNQPVANLERNAENAGGGTEERARNGLRLSNELVPSRVLCIPRLNVAAALRSRRYEGVRVFFHLFMCVAEQFAESVW